MEAASPESALCNLSRAKVTDFGMSRKLSIQRQEARGKGSFTGSLTSRGDISSLIIGFMGNTPNTPNDMNKSNESIPTKSPASEFSHEGVHEMMTARCGTPQWMAPELCKVEQSIMQKLRAADRNSEEGMQSFHKFKAENENVEYGQEVDNYAFAVIMWEMMHHQPPWVNTPTVQVFERVAGGERPSIDQNAMETAPDGWEKLMTAAWDDVPAERPSFSNIRKELALELEKRKEAQESLRRRYTTAESGRTWLSNVILSISRTRSHEATHSNFDHEDNSLHISQGNLKAPLLPTVAEHDSL